MKRASGVFGVDNQGGTGNSASFKILRRPSFPHPGKLTPETKHRDRSNSEAHSHHFHHIHFDGTIAGQMKLTAADQQGKKVKSNANESETKDGGILSESRSSKGTPLAANIAAATSPSALSQRKRELSVDSLTIATGRRGLSTEEGSRLSLSSIDMESVLANTDATLHLSNHMRANAIQCFQHHQGQMRGTLGLALDLNGSKGGEQGLPAQELRRVIMDLGHFPSEEECEDVDPA